MHVTSSYGINADGKISPGHLLCARQWAGRMAFTDQVPSTAPRSHRPGENTPVMKQSKQKSDGYKICKSSVMRKQKSPWGSHRSFIKEVTPGPCLKVQWSSVKPQLTFHTLCGPSGILFPLPGILFSLSIWWILAPPKQQSEWASWQVRKLEELRLEGCVGWIVSLQNSPLPGTSEYSTCLEIGSLQM